MSSIPKRTRPAGLGVYRVARKRRFHFPIMPLLLGALLLGAGWMFWQQYPAMRDARSQFRLAQQPPSARDGIPVAVADRGSRDGSARDASGKADLMPPWGIEEKLEPAGPPSNRLSEAHPTASEDSKIAALTPEPRNSTASATDTDQSAALNGSPARSETDSPSSAPSSSSTKPAVGGPAARPAPPSAGATSLSEALAQYSAGDRIAARHRLNALLANAAGSDADELRRHLARVAEETIFSTVRIADDPLIDEYAIQPRENLIEIAKKYDVPHQALLLLNPGLDPKRLLPGVRIKAPRGPFHLKVARGAFRLDLYLQDLYVRSFKIGIGGDNPTPAGTWKVVDRQENPTYYPPASAKDKRVIPGKDARNPLGTRFIRLQGIDGEAVGVKGIAIHGTNDPNSIGKAESLGCIRMLNEDVEYLYRLVRSDKSLVTILP